MITKYNDFSKTHMDDPIFEWNFLSNMGPFYSDLENILNKCADENNITEFLKIFNSLSDEFKNEYIKRNPQNKDIIDGLNIGMFSLKTENKINEASVTLRPGRLIKKLYPELPDHEIENFLQVKPKFGLSYNNNYFIEYNKDGQSYIITNSGEKIEIDIDDFLDSVGYLEFEIKLDKSMEEQDYLKFEKIFSKGKDKWKIIYKDRRPENEDIIDASNIGIFSLKTN